MTRQSAEFVSSPHAGARLPETDENGLRGGYLGQQTVAPDEGRSFFGAYSSQSSLAWTPPRTRNCRPRPSGEHAGEIVPYSGVLRRGSSRGNHGHPLSLLCRT